MIGAAGRTAAAAAIGGLVGAAWIAVWYAGHPALAIECDRDFPRNVSGIYSPERDAASGRTFAWTGEDAVIRLPGLDRRVPWPLDLRLRGGRRGDNPVVTILADGVAIDTRPSQADFEDLRAVIPPRPERRGLVLGLRSSATFVPGPADPRRLGIMLDRLALTPAGIALVPRPALEAVALSTAALAAAIALLGVTPASAIGAAIVLGAADAATVARGFGPFTDYPGIVVRLALAIGSGLALCALTAQLIRGRRLRNTARFAGAVSAAALFLKLLVLLHPDMPVGDAMFHAHRFQTVLAGHLFFTSSAPGGYAFPYPPGLYVFASLFAELVRRGAGDMALLRIVTASVDAAAGVLLYSVVARNWGNRLAGAMAVALYHLMPLSLAVLTTGNLTNAFAQSVGVAALAAMAWPTASRQRWVVALALMLLLAAAFLSHTSTLAILFAAAVLIAAFNLLSGDAERRRAGLVVGLAALAAAALAVAIYYARFMDTYRVEFTRLGHETAVAAPDAGGRTIGQRLAGVPYSLRINFGVPVLILTLAGAVEIAWRRRGRLASALAGWTLACAAFLALGILTPVDMRYYLAALPAVAIAAGCGAAWAWSDGWPRHPAACRATAAILLAAAMFTGFRSWWNVLG